MSRVDTATPNPVLNQILQDIEDCGGRKKAHFLTICNNSPGFYGRPGSQLRRAYQLAVDRVRRKTAVAYKQLVDDCGIVPCAATVEDTMEELRRDMERTEIKANKYEKSVKIDEQKHIPPKTPPRAKTPPPPLIDRSPPPSPGFSSPAPSVTSFSDTTEHLLSNVLNIDSTLGWSSDNPHIIAVHRGNMSLPHGFGGMFSDSVSIGSYERDVFYITKTIGGDLAKWKASIPGQDNFPEYKGRCILVEGPGLDYIHADHKTLQDSLTATLALPRNEIATSIADGLKRSMKKLTNYLKRDTHHSNQYYLFVYPPGTVFDNAAISGDGAADSVKTFGIRVNSKFSIFNKHNHTNIVCFWAIATKAEEDRRMNEFSGMLSSDLFDL